MWWHTRRNQIFVFRQNWRVHLNRRGRQFSRLLTAEVCASAVVMLDTTCSEVVWRVLATHSIRQFPLHFPCRTSPCAITFQLDSNFLLRIHESNRSFHTDVDNDSHVDNDNQLTHPATKTRVWKRLTSTVGKRREMLKFAKRKRVFGLSIHVFLFITHVSGLLFFWCKDIDIIYRNCYYLWLIQERKALNLWRLALWKIDNYRCHINRPPSGRTHRCDPVMADTEVQWVEEQFRLLKQQILTSDYSRDWL